MNSYLVFMSRMGVGGGGGGRIVMEKELKSWKESS